MPTPNTSIVVDLTTPTMESAASSGMLRRSARLASRFTTDVQTTRAQIAAENAIARMRKGKAVNCTKKITKPKHKLAADKTVTKVSKRTKESGKIAQQEKEESLLCPVCFVDLLNRDVNLSATSCGHVFCAECISETLNKHKRCPLCCKEETVADLRRIYFSHSSE